MANAIDYKKLLGAAAVSVLAEHKSAKLATKRRVRVGKGDARAWAQKTVSGWKPSNIEVFLLLADPERKDSFTKTSELAKRCKTTPAAVRAFLKRLRAITVRTRAAEGNDISQTDVRLFIRGSELFWSAYGVRMKLNTSMLTYAEARAITETTLGVTTAARDNYAVAMTAAEADTERSEEERSEARIKLNAKYDDVPVAMKQSGLFAEGAS